MNYLKRSFERKYVKKMKSLNLLKTLIKKNNRWVWKDEKDRFKVLLINLNET